MSFSEFQHSPVTTPFVEEVEGGRWTRSRDTEQPQTCDFFPASTSQVLEIEACTTMPGGFYCWFLFVFENRSLYIVLAGLEFIMLTRLV